MSTIGSKSYRVDSFEGLCPLRSYYPEEQTFLNRLSRFMSGQVQPILSMFSAPMDMGGFHPMIQHTQNPHVIFGDIHGEIRGFIENLLHAGLIDAEGRWAQKEVTLVQLGDVIDRGIFSEECWDYLSELQAQAKDSSGRVVRLMGNHELMVLQGDDHLAKWVIKDLNSFQEKLKKDVLEDRVQIAYTDGKRVFVHAGIRTEIRNILIKEIMEKQGREAEDIFVEDIVDYMNDLLKEAVLNDDFSHPIFYVGVSRGGQQLIGGVLWEDLTEMANSNRALDIPQVIGHNPPRGSFMPAIRITESQKLVEVDAGLNPMYGGRRAYVIFSQEDIHIVVKEQSKWVEQVAQDYLIQSPTRD